MNIELLKSNTSARRQAVCLFKGEKERVKAVRHSDELRAGAKKRKKLKNKEDKFHTVMSEFKRGTLHDSSGKVVIDRKQAVAIAISESGK